MFSLLAAWWVSSTKHDAELTGLDKNHLKEAEVQKIIQRMAKKALQAQSAMGSENNAGGTGIGAAGNTRSLHGLGAQSSSRMNGSDGCLPHIRGAIARQRTRARSFRGRGGLMKSVLEETEAEAEERYYVATALGDKEEKLDEGDITHALRGPLAAALPDVDEYRAAAWLSRQILEVCGEREWTTKSGQVGFHVP